MEYFYDPAGNRQSVVQTDALQNLNTDKDQSVTTWYNSNPSSKGYVPDPLNRVNNVVRNISDYEYETRYSYDKLGNITGIVYPGSNQTVEYKRDHFNRVKEIVGFTAPAGESSGITYNKMGVLQRVELPNQCTLLIASDELHRTSEINYTSTTGADINELFEYDQTGNRRKVAENVGEETTEEVYEIGPGNRITRAEDIRFEYDDNGNMIRRTNDATGEIWIYIYDARNCMTEVQKGGGSVRATVARYVYDPEGNRIKALYPQEGGSPEGGTNDGIYYHYDYTGMLTENPIVEEPVNGSKRNFIFLGRKLFARVDGEIGSGTKYWYMTDQLGSAQGLMDGSGNMVWWADYEAFGKAKGVGGPDSGAVNEVPRFTGKAFDERIGLYYFNARWYDPGLGRFMSEDSLGSSESTAFMYCLNNPIIYFDGDGHAPTISYPGPDEIPWPDNYEVPADDDGYRFDIVDGELTLVAIEEPFIPDPGIRPGESGNVDLLNALAYLAFITPEFQMKLIVTKLRHGLPKGWGSRIIYIWEQLSKKHIA